MAGRLEVVPGRFEPVGALSAAGGGPARPKHSGGLLDGHEEQFRHPTWRHLAEAPNDAVARKPPAWSDSGLPPRECQESGGHHVPSDLAVEPLDGDQVAGQRRCPSPDIEAPEARVGERGGQPLEEVPHVVEER